MIVTRNAKQNNDLSFGEECFFQSLPFLQKLAPFNVFGTYPDGQWEKQKSCRPEDSLYKSCLHLKHFKVFHLGQNSQSITLHAAMQSKSINIIFYALLRKKKT